MGVFAEVHNYSWYQEEFILDVSDFGYMKKWRLREVKAIGVISWSPEHLANIYVQQASRASLVSQLVKNLPAMQETWVWPLGWEDPLEKGMLPTPVFLPGELYGQRSPVGYSPWFAKSQPQVSD